MPSSAHTSNAPEERVFVYGTLRRGQPAEGLLGGCRFIRETSVRGTLYDVGGRFPALVLGRTGEVHGELWAVPRSRLASLDSYEGVEGGLFERIRVHVEGELCWTYVAGAALEPRLTPDALLPAGRWPR